MRSSRVRHLGAAVLVAALAACSSSSSGGIDHPTASGTANSTYVSPLTGRPARAAGPVYAVKIDNVAPARPQTGLAKADVIYVEPVEGGLSRMCAIFSTSLGTVGPVRSARESDLDLLKQYGPVGFVFSGANKGVLQSIEASDLVQLSPGQASSAYSRRGPHVAPHNLYVNLASLKKDVAPAQDVGFRFGDLPVGGSPAKRTVVRYGAATTAFTWNAAKKSWDVSLDGVRAPWAAPKTVVVQDTEVTQSQYHDVLGNPTPYTRTTGSGTATVLRDGQSFAATWARPSATNGTTYATTAGAPMLFAAGQTWIVFRAR